MSVPTTSRIEGLNNVCPELWSPATGPKPFILKSKSATRFCIKARPFTKAERVGGMVKLTTVDPTVKSSSPSIPWTALYSAMRF